jgi:hypothetical protein
MQVAGKTLQAYDNSMYPFSSLVEKISPERLSGKIPVYSTMFQFSDFMPPAHQLPELDLVFFSKERDGEIEARISFDSRRMSEATVKKIIGCFECASNIVNQDPDVMISFVEEQLEQAERAEKTQAAKERKAVNALKLASRSRRGVAVMQKDD